MPVRLPVINKVASIDVIISSTTAVAGKASAASFSKELANATDHARPRLSPPGAGETRKREQDPPTIEGNRVSATKRSHVQRPNSKTATSSTLSPQGRIADRPVDVTTAPVPPLDSSRAVLSVLTSKTDALAVVFGVPLTCNAVQPAASGQGPAKMDPEVRPKGLVADTVIAALPNRSETQVVPRTGASAGEPAKKGASENLVGTGYVTSLGNPLVHTVGKVDARAVTGTSSSFQPGAIQGSQSSTQSVSKFTSGSTPEHRSESQSSHVTEAYRHIPQFFPKEPVAEVPVATSPNRTETEAAPRTDASAGEPVNAVVSENPPETRYGTSLGGLLAHTIGKVDDLSVTSTNSFGEPGAIQGSQFSNQSVSRFATSSIPEHTTERQSSPVTQAYRHVTQGSGNAPVEEVVHPLIPSFVESAKTSPALGNEKPGHGVSKHESVVVSTITIGPEEKGIVAPGIVIGSAASHEISLQSLGSDIQQSTGGLVSPATEFQRPADGAGMPSEKPAYDASHSAVQDNHLNSMVQSAKLTERAGQAELRVGFRVGEFGTIDIRTSRVHNQITAQISVEHGDLRNLLVAEIPQLQSKLTSHQGRGADVIFTNPQSGGSGGSGQAYKHNPDSREASTVRFVETDMISGTTASSQIRTSAQLDIHM